MDTKKVGDLADRHKAELERRANAQEEEQAEHRRAQANMQQMVTEPWNVLGQELKEFEKAYNESIRNAGNLRRDLPAQDCRLRGNPEARNPSRPTDRPLGG